MHTWYTLASIMCLVCLIWSGDIHSYTHALLCIHIHFSDTKVHAMAYQSYLSYLEIYSTICTSNHDITKVCSSYKEQWFKTHDHHSMLCHLACAIQTIVVWSLGYSPLQGHETWTYYWIYNYKSLTTDLSIPVVQLQFTQLILNSLATYIQPNFNLQLILNLF